MRNYLIILTIAFITAACCDCPLEPNPDPLYNCLVREVTITEFRPGLQEFTSGDSTYLIPVPEYSIHTFLFPSDDRSSGILPNDDRFAEKERILIAKVPFQNNEPYFAAIYDEFPLNSDLKGDVLVVDADPSTLTADLRFIGSLAKLPNPLNSDDASALCDYIEANNQEIGDAADRATRYGITAPGAQINDYSTNTVEVLDQENNIVTGEPGVPSAGPDEVNLLLRDIQQAAVDIEVEPGDVFFYEAANGKEFLIVITDIFEGILPPFKKRVTFMFNPLG